MAMRVYLWRMTMWSLSSVYAGDFIEVGEIIGISLVRLAKCSRAQGHQTSRMSVTQ